MPRIRWLALLCLFASSPPVKGSVVLYDGALGAPGDQGWVFLTDPLLGSQATEAPIAGGVLVDTTARASDSAGYFSNLHPLVGTLDRTTGFVLSIEARLLFESHESSHRAALSFLVQTSDGRGIELGVWEDEIWAQRDHPLFTKGESASFDATREGIRYDLSIQGDDYRLSVGGEPVLEGPLRDYSGFGFPYIVPNFLFVGDDTSSASARFELSRIELAPQAAVPEAPAALLASAAAVSFALVVRARRRAG